MLIALVAVGSMAAHACDPLQQTEQWQKLMVVALAVTSIACLIGMAVSIEGSVARKTRLLLLSCGLLELAAAAAIITYYNHQTAASGLCG